MFLYNDGTRRHVIKVDHSNFHCTLCGNGLVPRYERRIIERFKGPDGRYSIRTMTAYHDRYLDYRCQSYECEFCQELYLLSFLDSAHGRDEKRYRFIDESSEILPEPFNQYVVKEGFLCRPDDGERVIFNHAGTSMEDKFAFGRGMFNMSIEDIVFGDMDKRWE